MRLLLAAMLAIPCFAQTRPHLSWIEQGSKALNEARYGDALYAFQKAVELNPSDPGAHQYLGKIYMRLWIPGAEAPANRVYAAHAEAEFRRTLEIQPENSAALGALASLAYNEASVLKGDNRIAKLHEARHWNQTLIVLDPRNKQAHYSLGVIAWAEWYPADLAARAQLEMKPADPGPLPSPVREQLRNRYAALIEDAIGELDRALAIDPQYEDAMSYLNLLIRERGDLRDSAAQVREDSALADQWMERAVETKKAEASHLPPPPPITPPPPQPSSEAPSMLRVSGYVQPAKLIGRIDPVCPTEAIDHRVESTLKFRAIVSEDGRISDLQFLSGDTLMIEAAADAIRQWTYTPTTINGEPVSVITIVELKMACGI